MENAKLLYVDIYRPIFDEDGVTTIDIKHLKKMDVYTDVSVQDVVFKLRQLIFQKYGDGLYIKAEEFDTICYLNVHVFFGEDISQLIEYLDSISSEKVATEESDYLMEANEEVTLFSIDYIDSEEIEEFKLLSESLGLNPKIYLEGQSAFERGAGDYHQIVIFVLNALTGGALNKTGSHVMSKLFSRYAEYQNASIKKFNPKVAIEYVSMVSGVNQQNLRLTKISPLNENEQEIVVTNRYKDFVLHYDSESKTFNYFEEKDKSHTMI